MPVYELPPRAPTDFPRPNLSVPVRVMSGKPGAVRFRVARFDFARGVWVDNWTLAPLRDNAEITGWQPLES